MAVPRQTPRTPPGPRDLPRSPRRSRHPPRSLTPLAAVDQEAARRHEVRWQIGQMTSEVRAALSKLPLLGEDSLGPPGIGLLASGALAMTIREIQSELTCEAVSG